MSKSEAKLTESHRFRGLCEHEKETGHRAPSPLYSLRPSIQLYECAENTCPSALLIISLRGNI